MLSAYACMVFCPSTALLDANICLCYATVITGHPCVCHQLSYKMPVAVHPCNIPLCMRLGA